MPVIINGTQYTACVLNGNRVGVMLNGNSVIGTGVTVHTITPSSASDGIIEGYWPSLGAGTISSDDASSLANGLNRNIRILRLYVARNRDLVIDLEVHNSNPEVVGSPFRNFLMEFGIRGSTYPITGGVIVNGVSPNQDMNFTDRRSSSPRVIHGDVDTGSAVITVVNLLNSFAVGETYTLTLSLQ